MTGLGIFIFLNLEIKVKRGNRLINRLSALQCRYFLYIVGSL